jgi:uncharacterized protein YjiS (DUF1127 family)
MNLLNLTIASVVDGATGSHLTQTAYNPHQTDNSNTAVAQRQGSRIRFLPHSFATVSRLTKEMIGAYKERAKGQKDMAHLFQLSAHILKDIGLTRDDVVDLKSGLISLGALSTRRREYQGQLDQPFKNPVISKVEAPCLAAANQDSYEQSSCG